MGSGCRRRNDRLCRRSSCKPKTIVRSAGRAGARPSFCFADHKIQPKDPTAQTCVNARIGVARVGGGGNFHAAYQIKSHTVKITGSRHRRSISFRYVGSMVKLGTVQSGHISQRHSLVIDMGIEEMLAADQSHIKTANAAISVASIAPNSIRSLHSRFSSCAYHSPFIRLDSPESRLLSLRCHNLRRVKEGVSERPH